MKDVWDELAVFGVCRFGERYPSRLRMLRNVNKCRERKGASRLRQEKPGAQINSERVVHRM